MPRLVAVSYSLHPEVSMYIWIAKMLVCKVMFFTQKLVRTTTSTTTSAVAAAKSRLLASAQGILKKFWIIMKTIGRLFRAMLKSLYIGVGFEGGIGFHGPFSGPHLL